MSSNLIPSAMDGNMSPKFRKIILIIVILALIGFGIWVLGRGKSNEISQKANLIRVNNLKPNQEIINPLYLEGEARGTWFFEASFPVRILDGNGNEIAVAPARANGEWMTEDFVPFSIDIEFNKPATEKGWVVFEKDNPSGLPQNADSLRIPIIFGTVEEVSKVKAYFSSNILNPGAEDCSKVFPVERIIPKTEAIARAALEELLKGPTNREAEQGYFSSINGNVKIQSLKIENEVAKVDFDDKLEFQVGGSCRVTAIRSQITQTLKQFSTVKSVFISINDRTEDILQP